MYSTPTVGVHSIFRDIFFKFWSVCQVVICTKVWIGGDLQKRKSGRQAVIIAMRKQSRTFAARPCPCNHYTDRNPRRRKTTPSLSQE